MDPTTGHLMWTLVISFTRPMPLDQCGLTRDTPLRLAEAARLAFPNGSVTASSLRREAAKGRLTIERVAGKDFTTLAHIERMRELCRVEAKDLASSCGRNDATPTGALPIAQPGEYETARETSAQAALNMMLQQLSVNSPNISLRNMNRRESSEILSVSK